MKITSATRQPRRARRASSNALFVALLVLAGLAGLAGLSRSSRAYAQSPAASADRPVFEVASIKPHDPADRMPVNIGTTIYQPGGRWRGTNVVVRTLVLQAFQATGHQLRSEQLVGGPAWLDSSRFDIVATAGGNPTTEAFLAQLPRLLRSLLEDRCQLQTHMETRPLPVYALVTARSDGRLGPGLHPTTTDCEAYARERRANPITKEKALAMMAAGERAPCESSSSGTGSFSGRGITLRALAGSLGSNVDRMVVDRTERSGIFDIELRWTPEGARSSSQAADPAGTPATADGPSIFTALQEQLGLKLEPRREPMDVLVIDRVEPPTPN